MAVKIIIRRRVPKGRESELLPLMIQLRSKAITQSGYISGETLSNVDNPEECLVISRWQTIDDWNRWSKSQHRAEIEDKIEALTGEKSDYTIYAPMVPR